MKLNFPFLKSKAATPKMMTREEVEAVHTLLVAVVMGKTALRFQKLRKGEDNPLQMMAEVFAYVLNHEHGAQVGAVIADIRSKLAMAAHQAEQNRIVSMIQNGYEPPPAPTILPPPDATGAA